MMSFDYTFPFNYLDNSNFKELFGFKRNKFTKNNSNFSCNKFNYVDPSKITFKSMKQNSLSVLVINIRSLNKNFPKLKILLHEIKIKPTVIIVSETWITDTKPFLFTLDDYNFFNKPSNTRAGGAGIFLKKDINFNILNNVNLDINGCEDLWINISLTSNKSIIISSIYNHPSNDIKLFKEKLLEKIEIINLQNKKFIIGGDINIDFISNQKQITCYKNDLLSQGISQLVKLPTRCSKKSKTLIDHLYTNIPEEKTKTDCLIFDISDHLPILSYFTPYQSLKPVTQQKLIRDFRNFKQDKFLEELSENLNIIKLFKQTMQANDLWDKFENI